MTTEDATTDPTPPRTERTTTRRSGGVARASAVMAAGTLTSRVLGLARAALLTAVLGAAAADLAANAFAVSNSIPNALYLLIAGGALNAILVPQIVRADADGAEGRERLDRLFTVTVVGLAAVTIAMTAGAGLLIDLYTDDWGPQQRGLAVAFAVWALPQVFFYGLYSLFGQVLNARGSFGPYMWAPVANNVVVVVALAAILLTVGPLTDRAPEDFGPGLVAALAGTATLGVVVQALVLVPSLRAVGFRFRPRWRWRGTGLRSAGSVAAWTFGALVVSQVAWLVMSNVASAAGQAAVVEGTGDSSASNAAWSWAFLVFMLPHSLIAVSVVTAQFTGFARAAEADDVDRLRRDARSAVRLLLVGMAVPAAALVVLAQPIAVLLFGDDSGDGGGRALAIGSVLVMMALGLPAFSATYQLQRVFYAMTDGRTPFVVSASTSGMWIVGMVVLSLTAPPELVMPGTALILAVTQNVSCLWLVWALSRRLGRLGGIGILSVGGRAAAGAAVAAVAGIVVVQVLGADTASWVLPTVATRADALLAVAGGGVLVAGVFVVVAWLLRLQEVEQIAGIVRRVASRRARRASRHGS